MSLCLLGCAALLGILGCSRPASETQSHGGPVRDHVSFLDTLRREGYAVEIAGEVQQPFLRARGTRLSLSGGGLEQPAELQSYDYEDPDAARADAESIGPDGNPKNTSVNWIAPPHFYLQGRVLVLYLGSDPKVIQLLNGLLGSQVAGP